MADPNNSDSSADFDHLAELDRVLEVLWIAYDGGRMLQRGEQTVYDQAAAPLAAQIRATLAEKAALLKAKPAEVSGIDQLSERRASRQSNAKRLATPTRQRR